MPQVVDGHHTSGIVVHPVRPVFACQVDGRERRLPVICNEDHVGAVQGAVHRQLQGRF